MEPNQISAQPSTTTSITPSNPQPIVSSLPSAHPSKLPIIILSFLLLASLVGLIYLYMQIKTLKNQLGVDQPASTATLTNSKSLALSPDPSTTIDKTADWKTYTSPQKTTIQYPPDWKIDTKYTKDINDDTAEDKFFSFTLSKELHSITIAFPDGFGPGICIFKDQPEFVQDLEPNPVSVKCEGEFVEIKGISSIHRRLSAPPKPLENGTPAEWGIYTRNSNDNYITLPPIAYKVPTNYDQKTLATMDHILATFESVK